MDFIHSRADKTYSHSRSPPNEIPCQPHADQEIPVWLDSVFTKDNALTHFDDGRLHHYPPAKVVDKFKSVKRVCDFYMGVRSSLPEQMRSL